MPEHDILQVHKDMAAMDHGGKTELEIAEHVKMSATELGEEWEHLRKEMRAATREDAVELLIAQMILEARKALKSEERKLALILASREGKAVLTMNFDGIITGVSPFAEKMIGMPPERIIGQPIDALLDARGKGVEQSMQEMQRAEAGEHVESVRTHRRSDGSTFRAEHCVVAIVGRTGEVSGFIRDIEDVTQRKVHEVKIAELDASIALLVQK